MRAFVVAVVMLAMACGCSREKPVKPAVEAKKAAREPQPGELYMLTEVKGTWPDHESIMKYSRLLGEPEEPGKPSPSSEFRYGRVVLIASGSKVRIIEIVPTTDEEQYNYWKVLVELDATDPTEKAQQGKDMTGKVRWIDRPKSIRVER